MKMRGPVWGGRGARFALSAGILSLVTIASPALALEGIGVSPTSQEVSVDPGSTISGELTVINDGTTDITYKVDVSDYQVTGEKYQGTFNATGASYQISPITWFAVPQGNKVIKAGQQTKIPYSITPPVTATPGGHYAVVFIETIPPKTTGGTVINRVQKIGSIFYIAVSGNIVKGGNSLGITSKFLQLNPPIAANLRVSNTGNVHFAVEGQSYTTNLFGHKTAPVSFRGEVLPRTTRSFSINLTPDSPIGLYKVTSEYTFLDQKQSSSKWVLLIPPVTLGVIIFTLIVLLILGIVGLLRKRKKTKQV